ncbi:hypothetical protein CDEST_07875 [Colletotrichum destructivum]|uniref:Uncharacterized protein n=1 Tax=Colletotrichum destructivum TaxID=34406 RepID=A0AAX4IID2_9PEZI|nr:hypothetical protein CDEST_07875 [Colletotrichum destructivum]
MRVRLPSSQRLIYEWGTRHLNPDGGQSVTERTLFHSFLLSRLDSLKGPDVDGGGFCIGMDSKRFFPPRGLVRRRRAEGGPSGSASPGGDLHRSSRLLLFSSLGLCSTMFLGIDDGASDWSDDFFSQLLRRSRDNKVALRLIAQGWIQTPPRSLDIDDALLHSPGFIIEHDSRSVNVRNFVVSMCRVVSCHVV